jgi:hypothetical protein
MALPSVTTAASFVRQGIKVARVLVPIFRDKLEARRRKRRAGMAGKAEQSSDGPHVPTGVEQGWVVVEDCVTSDEGQQGDEKTGDRGF